MALTAAGADASWYMLMSLLVSHPAIYSRLRARAVLIDRTFGILLVLLALSVGYRALLA